MLQARMRKFLVPRVCGTRFALVDGKNFCAEANMPSPLAALMGLASGAMSLLQKVFTQPSAPSGFDEQLTAALKGCSPGRMSPPQKPVTDQGALDEDPMTALPGDPRAVPLLELLSDLKSMGLTSGDVRALLLGDAQGVSDEGIKTILAAGGLHDADIGRIMSDPVLRAELKAELARSVSSEIRRQFATTGLDVDQLIEKTTSDAAVAQFVLSKERSWGTAQEGESTLFQASPAGGTKVSAEITGPVSAAMPKNPVSSPAAESLFADIVQARVVSRGQAQVAAMAASADRSDPAAVTQVAGGVDELENTLKIPRKIIGDLLFSCDPQVRQAAVQDATERIASFLEANAGRELPRQVMQALGLLKGGLTRQEFSGIDHALNSFNPDLAAAIQPFTVERAVFDVLLQNLGEEPAGTTGRYAQDVMERVRQAVLAAVKGNEGTFRVKLNPPLLGRVDIDIRVEDGQIHASFKVDQPVTRDILQQNMHVLREAMNEQGIKVTQFTVTTDSFNARDNREALAWFGPGNGRGGSQDRGRGQGSESPSKNLDEYGNGYTPARRFADGGGLDIFA